MRRLNLCEIKLDAVSRHSSTHSFCHTETHSRASESRTILERPEVTWSLGSFNFCKIILFHPKPIQDWPENASIFHWQHERKICMPVETIKIVCMPIKHLHLILFYLFRWHHTQIGFACNCAWRLKCHRQHTLSVAVLVWILKVEPLVPACGVVVDPKSGFRSSHAVYTSHLLMPFSDPIYGRSISCFVLSHIACKLNGTNGLHRFAYMFYANRA